MERCIDVLESPIWFFIKYIIIPFINEARREEEVKKV